MKKQLFQQAVMLFSVNAKNEVILLSPLPLQLVHHSTNNCTKSNDVLAVYGCLHSL